MSKVVILEKKRDTELTLLMVYFTMLSAAEAV
jgi:hypothetical protein